jgi:hypothetical protein
MKTSTSFVSSFLSLLVLSLLVAACGDGSKTSGAGSTGTAGTSASNTVGAVAVLGSQLNMAGGAGFDPNALYLVLEEPEPTCATLGPRCSGFNVYIEVTQPLGMQPLGSYNLFHPSDCSLDGAPFNAGTATITSMDATSVHFTISGAVPAPTLSGMTPQIPIDGVYVAPRCP